MSRYENGNWHNFNGGLPYRPPPTVDEALPYSPFTSIVPFSSDIIPFPTAEPPTPPSTLTSDQQNAARKAVTILNDEIKGQSTAQHLSDTLRQLRDLLHPDKLPEYNFKAMPQLVTPPPDSPVNEINGTTPSSRLALSPFASTLLKHTEIAFGISSPESIRKTATPAKSATPSAAPTLTIKTETPIRSGLSVTPIKASPTQSAPASSSIPLVRPNPVGPVVIIKPKSVVREEYQKFDTGPSVESSSQEKKKDLRTDNDSSALRPHEREIADRKIDELESLVTSLSEEKDDPDGSVNFVIVSTPDGDLNVLKPKRMAALSDNMSNVVNLGRFSALPVPLVMQIQSLLSPSITSTTKTSVFTQDDSFDWASSLETAKSALKASRLTLDTMIEGRDDHRMRREEIIDCIIDLIKSIKDACIMPIIQSRRSGLGEELFAAVSGHKKELQSVLRLCGSLFSRFAVLIGKYNLSDRALNTLEYMALELLVEQNSESEKDSIFTIAKFEQFRQRAMDVLAQVFARNAEQRKSILNGILSNLEKLPDKKASARQFRSAHDVSIMTISALFMRFVQVAATNRETHLAPVDRVQEVANGDEEASDYEPGTASSRSPQKKRKDIVQFGQLAHDLTLNATHIASHIAMSLIERASNVSKTGDKPFRNLLDLFIEDFCNVLGSPEWPGAVILLQQLLVRMYSLLQGEQAAKQSVVDKDMALATMARIGCGVIDFRNELRKLKRDLDVSQSELSAKLDNLLEDAVSDDLKEGINDMDLLAFEGPYRMVLESLRSYLDLPPAQEDAHLGSVYGCYVSLWLSTLTKAFPEDEAQNHSKVILEIREHLESMIVDSKWLARRYTFPPVSVPQSKLAAGIITLQSQVCRYLPQIVNIMLGHTRDKNSSKLRSRGMSSLEQLIHKDPRVITEQAVKDMVGLFTDTSPMVRESTLNLVATCLDREPALERYFLPHILRLTTDTSNGPKKKAIKLLKEVYAGSDTSEENRLRIAAQLLMPSQDDEKAIAELTRNVLEDIWLSSGASTHKVDDSKLKLVRNRRATLITNILQRIQGSRAHLEAFEKFFVYALSPESKNSTSNVRTCRDLVADMVDAVISPDSGVDAKSQSRTMAALSIFAKAKPSLFTSSQVQLLKLYIKEIANTEDLALVQPTVTVFRYVFPILPALQQTFAEEVRASLMKNVSKLANWASQGITSSRDTLEHVAYCLWTITEMADQGPSKLCATIASILCQLRPLISCTKEQAAEKRTKINSYLILLGTFGKVCNFDQYIAQFREKLIMQIRAMTAKKMATTQQLEPLLNDKSTASLLLLETVRPFTMQSWDMNIREQALQSVGGICQQSPKLFMRAEIEKVFKLVFINNDNALLKRIALSEFHDYFTFAERRSETGAEIAVGQGAESGSARLETSFVANENDSATLHLAQKFLADFVDIALKNDNDMAVFATNIIASISRQGLVHPKECGAALVALGTSYNESVAQTASLEHKRIHEKQESYLEKEYMQAIRMAYEYQRDVFNDTHGMREATYGPKLARLFEALKTGKKATFKKFIQNLCKHIDFDMPKLDVSATPPDATLFARFCLENMAGIDFVTLEDLAKFFLEIEAIVLKNTGPTVALAIETEMPKQYEQPSGPSVMEQQNDMPVATFIPQMAIPAQLIQPDIEQTRLRQITTACMILQMVWETRTFVRRCYNLHKLVGRIPQKEYLKPAQRNNFVSGKELWDRFVPIMRALDSRESMIKQCYDFADLLDIDREAQVADEEDGVAADMGAGYETPPDNGEGPAYPTSGRGRKRKNNVSLTNTPKKARGRPTGGKGKKRNSRTPEGDEDDD